METIHLFRIHCLMSRKGFTELSGNRHQIAAPVVIHRRATLDLRTRVTTMIHIKKSKQTRNYEPVETCRGLGVPKQVDICALNRSALIYVEHRLQAIPCQPNN
ncbi:hypothetical protein CBL_04212 [Carabus blaptoides fortunei]